MKSKQKVLTLGGALVAAASTVAGGVVALGPAASAAGTPECTNGDVTASYVARDAAMSHRFGTLVLTNTSDTTCFVQGYGGLSYVGSGDGTQVGAPASRTPSKVRKVVLKPGDKARSAVSETTVAPYPKSTCKPTKVDGFRVYVPDSKKSQFVVHKTTTCANPDLQTLTHKAFH